MSDLKVINLITNKIKQYPNNKELEKVLLEIILELDEEYNGTV